MGAETEEASEGRIGIPDMQEVSAREFSEIAGKLSEDFAVRLKVKEAPEDEEDEEFSFSNAFGDRSPVAAEDVFEDGWIRPVFPLFNRELFLSGEEGDLRPPVKKLFVEEVEEDEAEGPYCEWDGKKAVVIREAATTECKKSNSTGFSKLWRLRELTTRSNSDGKDAFVFLSSGNDTKKKTKKKVVKKEKSAKVATSFSTHYATSRAKKEEDKRVSYLPYRVGFFTNVSGGMSRNVHPF